MKKKMNESMQSLTVCKSFLDRCPPGVSNGLSGLLSPNDQRLLHEIPTPGPFAVIHLEWDLLDHTHFSWLAPFLRTFTKHDISAFLAALKKQQQEGLKKALGYGNGIGELTEFSKKALRNILLKQLVENQNLTPFAFLPSHPLNRILTLSDSRLKELIRYLGLHDLSYETRQIISTKELKKIFGALSTKEAEYLNRLTLQSEPLIFKRLFLKNWDGSREQIQKLIDERGIHRLSHALYGANESLIWYVTHRLEIHQGGLLHKLMEKPTHPRTFEILEGQITKILETSEKGDPS